MKPAHDRTGEIAEEQVVAAGRKGHEVRGRRCASEVGEHARGRVAVAREVDELDAELARELRRGSPAAYAGVVIDGDAVAQGEIKAHRNELHRRETGPNLVFPRARVHLKEAITPLCSAARVLADAVVGWWGIDCAAAANTPQDLSPSFSAP